MRLVGQHIKTSKREKEAEKEREKEVIHQPRKDPRCALK